MKYPIDVEQYIVAMRIEFGKSDSAEEAARIVLPQINAAYCAGLEGRENGLLSSCEVFLLHETDDFARQIVAAVGRMGSRAYEQGRLDASKAA